MSDDGVYLFYPFFQECDDTGHRHAIPLGDLLGDAVELAVVDVKPVGLDDKIVFLAVYDESDRDDPCVVILVGVSKGIKPSVYVLQRQSRRLRIEYQRHGHLVTCWCRASL